MISKEEFSRRLQGLMDERDITRADLSRATGIPFNSLTNWINCKSFPKAEALGKLSAYFGVDLSTGIPYSRTAQRDFQRGLAEYQTDDPMAQIAQLAGYYADPVTAELADRIHKDPNYRALFDAAADATPEDLALAVQILNRMKSKGTD